MIFDTHGTVTGPDAPQGHSRILWQDGILTVVKGDNKWETETPKPAQSRPRAYTAGEYQIKTAGCKCSCGPTCKASRRELLNA